MVQDLGITAAKTLRLTILVMLLVTLVSLLLQLEYPSYERVKNSLILYIADKQQSIQNKGEQGLINDGWMYYNLGDFERAKLMMEEASLHSQSISAVYCLALIDLRSGFVEKGIAKLEAVASKSPKHVPTQIALGKAYYQLHYYGKARNNLEKATYNEPTNEEARLWLGKTYLKLNKTELALGMLETVTRGRESVEAAALIKNILTE